MARPGRRLGRLAGRPDRRGRRSGAPPSGRDPPDRPALPRNRAHHRC
jgi:hypothetical protein